jgi:alcohol dehydrogenase class IV
MMAASTQAGMAFSNSSVTLVHRMSRPIGAQARYARFARAYGVAEPTTSDERASQAMVDALAELCDDLDVPTPNW